MVLLLGYYFVSESLCFCIHRRLLQLTDERVTVLFNRCTRSKFNKENSRGLINLWCSKRNLGFIHAYLRSGGTELERIEERDLHYSLT